MNIKKIIAGVSACTVVFGAVPCFQGTMPDFRIVSNAETYETLKYTKYSDHIEIYDCDESAISVEIPAEINGLPVTVIGDRAFYDCSSLTEITIPDSITSIGYGAFSCCSSLTEITIPDSITSIENVVFEFCSNLKEVTIPDSVTNISGDAFYCCLSLTNINVSDKNEYYSSENGILFNKNKTELIKYPSGKIGKVYTIPDSVTNIGYWTFYGCSGLKEITIPDSVANIGDEAFFGCSGLKEVTIPDSVTSIGSSAFSRCTSLTSITIKNPECKIYDYIISDTTTIYGCENSTAQAYAEEYGYKFALISEKPTTVTGDVNGDGEISISDVVSITAFVANSERNPLDQQNILNGDVHNTGDGLTANDALMIQQQLADIIPEF